MIPIGFYSANLGNDFNITCMNLDRTIEYKITFSNTYSGCFKFYGKRLGDDSDYTFLGMHPISDLSNVLATNPPEPQQEIRPNNSREFMNSENGRRLQRIVNGEEDLQTEDIERRIIVEFARRMAEHEQQLILQEEERIINGDPNGVQPRGILNSARVIYPIQPPADPNGYLLNEEDRQTLRRQVNEQIGVSRDNNGELVEPYINHDEERETTEQLGIPPEDIREYIRYMEQQDPERFRALQYRLVPGIDRNGHIQEVSIEPIPARPAQEENDFPGVMHDWFYRLLQWIINNKRNNIDCETYRFSEFSDIDQRYIRNILRLNSHTWDNICYFSTPFLEQVQNRIREQMNEEQQPSRINPQEILNEIANQLGIKKQKEPEVEITPIRKLVLE